MTVFVGEGTMDLVHLNLKLYKRHRQILCKIKNTKGVYIYLLDVYSGFARFRELIR